MKTAAVIDIGSNTFTLLIFEYSSSNEWKEVFKKQDAVGLGKTSIANKHLSNDSLTRSKFVLESYRDSLSDYKIEKIKVYATATLREVDNQIDFLNLVKDTIGASVSIIDGLQEAELIYHGVKNAINLGNTPKLIMDIGGGSVEFIIADANEIFYMSSHLIGLIVLKEKFQKNHPMDIDSQADLRTFLKQELKDLFVVCKQYSFTQLVGASGTFETLVDIENVNNLIYNIHPFINHKLDMDYYQQVSKQILESDYSSIKSMIGMKEFRAEMMPVALILIDEVVKGAGIKQILVSDYSLKEGAMFKMIVE